MALRIGGGDEVITTPLSAVASSLAILAVGAKPVFVDINDRGQLDASLVEAKITKKTKAILPVNLYGLSPDYQLLKKLAKKHHLPIIEDAAQAHGSYYQQAKLGTFGDISCFSFYPTKNLGAFGDGGAIATNNEKIADTIRQLRNYGQKDRYIHNKYGLNSRLDEIQASILRVRLKYLDQDNNKRRLIAREYLKKLKGLKQVTSLSQTTKDLNFHLFVVKVKKRSELMEHLSVNGIPSLIHYPILIPDQPFLKKQYPHQNLPQAKKFVKQILSLPCHPWLSLDQVDHITNKVIKFYD